MGSKATGPGKYRPSASFRVIVSVHEAGDGAHKAYLVRIIEKGVAHFTNTRDFHGLRI